MGTRHLDHCLWWLGYVEGVRRSGADGPRGMCGLAANGACSPTTSGLAARERPFRDYREGRLPEVDAVSLWGEAAAQGSCQNWFRRVFGKSPLVSTLKAYFEGRRDLFEGLAIECLEMETAANERREPSQARPVLHLSLNAGDYTKQGALEAKLHALLTGLEGSRGTTPGAREPGDRLLSLLRRADGKRRSCDSLTVMKTTRQHGTSAQSQPWSHVGRPDAGRDDGRVWTHVASRCGMRCFTYPALTALHTAADGSHMRLTLASLAIAWGCNSQDALSFTHRSDHGERTPYG